MGAKNINEREYQNIKQLLHDGAKVQTITNVTGRSSATISRIRSAQSYSDIHKGYKTKPQAIELEQASLIQSVPAEDVFTRLQAMDAKIDKILGRLESRVGSKKKRGWL